MLSFCFFSQQALAQSSETAQLRQLAQLAEYIAVDYVAAVENGEVVNEDEYQEMLEFSSIIVSKVSSQFGAEHETTILSQSLALEQAIIAKSSISHIRQLSGSIRGQILAVLPESLLPARLLSEQSTQALFQENCSSCHGVMGKGDGVLAQDLSPEPTNFTDKERAMNRSLLGLFDAISNGLDDTAMPAFTQLKEHQRWSLAFYVGSLAFKTETNTSQRLKNIDLQKWINLNPSQLINNVANIDVDFIDTYRATPKLLFNEQQSPITIAKSQLNAALNAYYNNDYQKANTLAVSAYLDGFELIEHSLDARDEVLRKRIEVNFINLRHVISVVGEETSLLKISAEIFEQLDEAEQLLTGSALSSSALFTASLVILLREGLEALLVVIALMTVLIRTNRRDALKYVHLGWLLALIAGVGTWAVAQTVIDISGASREVMEGVAAMLAAIMLLYVGIWMHSKTNADQWQAYIQKHINTQLRSGTLWGLTLLAFIAVYREVFETVLFYQSLLTQAEPSQFSVAVTGFMAGVVILTVIAWVILKYSIKLPIARFFAATTYLLLALAFILMGKAISALQEAALISISPLPIHLDIPWIGVGSSWQGAFAQIAVILAFVLYRIATKQKTMISK
ncbi:iron permease [Cognaticolwellia beringensis]|uniref:Iron permease n=2 Tax=Cognaticolwellia beringensis TaxID=1967665 RepID=A0A222GDV7_9GAMM|nr:iron permease [Cognaticolwellia beringensis]